MSRVVLFGADQKVDDLGVQFRSDIFKAGRVRVNILVVLTSRNDVRRYQTMRSPVSLRCSDPWQQSI
jgi:hypothetical protein